MERGATYFFFRRFAAFFATFFAFLFFAIAALLATICGDVGTVPPRIDVHCIPITPARRKKHRLHLTDRVRARRYRPTKTEIGAHRARSRRTNARDDECASENSALRENLDGIWLFACFVEFNSSPHLIAKTPPRRRFAAEKLRLVSL